jgi:hypothetical protein
MGRWRTIERFKWRLVTRVLGLPHAQRTSFHHTARALSCVLRPSPCQPTPLNCRSAFVAGSLVRPLWNSGKGISKITR